MPRSAREDPAIWSDQSVATADDVPRWLIVSGACVGVALALGLLRYAIDLLGLLFVIVLVGFSIHALTDWLTNRDSVSTGSIATVCISLFGTLAVGVWLFGSSAARAANRLEQRLPVFMLDAIQWAETKGWGQRVLLAAPYEAAPPSERAMAPARVAPPAAGAAPAPGIDPPAPDTTSPAAESSRTPAALSVSSVTSGTLDEASFQTTTTLTVTSQRMAVGKPFGLRAVVSAEPAGSPAPHGTVVFWRDTVALGSVALEADGSRASARLTTVAVPVGTHELSAEYAGTPRFRPSRSAPVRQVVTRP